MEIFKARLILLTPSDDVGFSGIRATVNVWPPLRIQCSVGMHAVGSRGVLLVRIVILIATMAFTASCFAAKPDRTASAHAVSSSDAPRVRVRLPDDATYVGSDRFMLAKPELGDFDACELFAFADADKNGALRRYYWVQFEEYLPKYPDLHYTYDSPRHVTIGGLDFYVDIEASEGTGKPKPGSDGEHFYNLLAAHGYKRVPMMFLRLVHLPDDARRKELMIIVGQRLADGVTVASL